MNTSRPICIAALPPLILLAVMAGATRAELNDIRFTAVADMTGHPMGMELRLEYGTNHVGETWAFYSADWVPFEGWPLSSLDHQWELASEDITLSGATNELQWTDTGQLGREPWSNIVVRAYLLGSRADSDGDGLADADEVLIYGTDPFNADSDGDWFSDGYEVAYDTDPLDGDSSPPFRMLINEGAYYWPSIELQITFEGVVADAVTIAEDFSFSNPVFMPLSFPSNTVTYTATPGTNPRHRVFAKLHRGAGEETFAFMAIGLLDPTPPELVVTTPTNYTVTSDPWIAVAGHVIETNSTARVEVNGAYVDGFWGEEFRKARCRLVPGTNLLEVVATDRAGHSSTQVVVVIQDLALDTQAPTAALLLPEDFQIVQGATSWLGSTTFGAGDWLYVEGWSDDETARVELLAEQDGATNGPYSVRNLGTSFWGRVRLHEGANTLWLLAEDAAGNAFSTNYSVIRDSSFHIEIVEPAPYAVVNARSTVVRGVASPMFSNATIQVNGIPATLTLETDHVTFETDAPVPLNSGYTSLAGVAVLDGRSYLFDPPVLDYQILSWSDRLDSWFEGHIIKAGGCIEYLDSVSYYTRTWNHLDGLFAWTTWGWSSTYFDCGPTFDNSTFGPFGDSNAVETPPVEYILLGEEIYINELHDFDLDVWQPFRETGMTQIEFILPGDPGQENASARPAFFDFHGLTYDSVFSHSPVTTHDPTAVRFRGQPGFATENGTGFIVPIEVGTPQTISAGDFEWPSFSHVQPGGGTGSYWGSFAGHVLLFDTVDISILKVEIDVAEIWVIPANTDWPGAPSEMVDASTLTITTTTDPPGFENLVELQIDRVEPLDPATGSGTLTRHESDPTIWYYGAFAEPKSLRHPVNTKVHFLATVSGVEASTEHITVSPVFRHLSSPMLGIYTQDRESAWRYARWKYDIDTSNLNSIVYNPSLSERGIVRGYITGVNNCELGPAAFANWNPDSGENLCASTLGHENVHGGQGYFFRILFPDCAEADAYLWELDNAQHTGISQIDYDDIEQKYNDHISKCNR